MKEDILLGRVIGETDAFVDVEFCGHDIRNLLALHASKCDKMLSDEVKNKIVDVVSAYLWGDVAGACLKIRIQKNCYAIANSHTEIPK